MRLPQKGNDDKSNGTQTILPMETLNQAFQDGYQIKRGQTPPTIDMNS
jgi:hypothetical protein